MIVPRILLVLPAFLAAAVPMGCGSLLKGPDPPAVVTVDFLAPMGLRANALAPKAVVADPVRNRVFASCANSCAVSVIDCASMRAAAIPAGARIPAGLREEGMKVGPVSGRLYVCGGDRLIAADPASSTARSIPLPGGYEALDLDEREEHAFLAGRTRPDLAVVDLESGRVRLLPFDEAGDPLPFAAASAPPPIRVPFKEPGSGRVHVVDGLFAKLHTIDVREGKPVASRKLPVEPFPRWHTAGFDPEAGRIYAVLEDEQRRARFALAIDTRGEKDVVVELPEGHKEPAGVACDPGRGELFIPYDNNKVIHVVDFNDQGAVASIALPGSGVDASEYDPGTRRLYAAGWNEAALYIVDVVARKTVFTVPFFPVYPHMNSMAFNPADGRLYVPSGSTAVNGTFGSAISVFDPATLAFTEVRTGFGPVSLAQKPGSRSFYVFGAEQEFAEVAPDGAYQVHRLPHPYPRQALPSPDGKHVLVAYGPHSSMWPTFYIKGTRNGIWFIDERGRVVEDRLTPRLVQGMLFDREGNLWALQNTWGREEPFLLCHPADGGEWFDLRLPPALDNECVQRLLAMDAESGLLYAGRAGNLATDPGRVHVADPEARKVLRSVEVGRTPTGICVLPERSLVFVSNFDDDTVTLLRGSGEKVKDEPVGPRPIALAADRSSETVYVVNHLGASLTVLGKTKKTVPLPEGALPNNLIVDPGSGAVYITAHGENEARIYQYDPAGGKVRTLYSFAHPYGEVNFDRSEAAFRLRGQWGDGLFRVTEMALDDSGRLWVADYLGGKLWILRTR